jgi:DNA-directed RNA polymerase sigma subunit (sigma70/sigma32)
LDIFELIDEGVLGMEHGLRKFDFTRGNTLLTYITWWMEQKMDFAIKEQTFTISASRYTHEMRTKIFKLIDRKTQQFGRLPAAGEVIDDLGMSLDKLYFFLHSAHEPYSFEKPTIPGEENSRHLGDTFADHLAIDPEEALIERETENEILRRWSLLTVREQKVVELYFWSDPSGNTSSIRKVAEEIGSVMNENDLLGNRKFYIQRQQVADDLRNALYILQTGERYHPRYKNDKPPRIL